MKTIKDSITELAAPCHPFEDTRQVFLADRIFDNSNGFAHIFLNRTIGTSCKIVSR